MTKIDIMKIINRIKAGNRNAFISKNFLDQSVFAPSEDCLGQVAVRHCQEFEPSVISIYASLSLPAHLSWVDPVDRLQDSL